MAQLEHIEAIERRLWSAADTLRANSGLAGNEYFLPVMGLVFLRHAYSRYLAVKPEVEAALATRRGRRRPAGKEDYSRRNAILLQPEAQFDRLVALPDREDRAGALIAAMESIEKEYESLRGALPKAEYRQIGNDVLGQLLRTLNPDELKRVSGDVFGRIYEYFLTRFADQKAHDGGEFFTPVSLVSLIANVLEPDGGRVLDPACGSGGMFVQSARTVEERGGNPTERLTFLGMEKNETTIRLARMNLAVHGLEGNLRQANAYYEDPHELLGKADYVMANPPFNVDEIDAEKVKTDPRLPFGLPGVNKKEKVSNGNYIWISYFRSYLNETGRAGFVMSSQASSAGRAETAVRRNLVETGEVDVMIAIRANFFYTRTVPCELWFLNRGKPEEHRNRVLMLDARSIYRKVTRKIYDFSPEQQKNLLAIVWLYRGESRRFLDLVSGYSRRAAEAAKACVASEGGEGDTPPLAAVLETSDRVSETLSPFLRTLAEHGPCAAPLAALEAARAQFEEELSGLPGLVDGAEAACGEVSDTAAGHGDLVEQLTPLAEACRMLRSRADELHQAAGRLIETCERECGAKSNGSWNAREVSKARKEAEAARAEAAERLAQARYFWCQARWLTARFPEAKLRDVEGLVKLVDRAEIEANDWSLTPGRFVGVAPEEEDEDFDFRAAMREIHAELDALDAESVRLAATIRKNFETLGI